LHKGLCFFLSLSLQLILTIPVSCTGAHAVRLLAVASGTLV
jgi:hypothetical protein